MTCRCASTAEHTARAESRAADNAREDERRRQASSPDIRSFTVEDGEVIGPHLVLKVKYPNCTLCEYEGCKVMVFLNVDFKVAIKWRVIDPHFRDPKKFVPTTEAPSPAARFPASKEGWQDAIEYATKKSREKSP